MEIVKRATDAFNRLDLDGVVETATPDIEVISAMTGLLESGNYCGGLHTGVHRV